MKDLLGLILRLIELVDTLKLSRDLMTQNVDFVNSMGAYNQYYLRNRPKKEFHTVTVPYIRN